MKITVLGAGAIGSLVAGYLKLKGIDTCLVGHSEAVSALREKGLRISGVRGDFNLKIEISDKLNYKSDLIILATKTQDIDKALEDNLKFIQDTIILTTQNGVRADDIVRKYTHPQNIISSIVMFGATYLEPGLVVHNFEGSWIMGRIFSKNDEKVIEITQLINQIFPTIVTEDIKEMKYLKIFVNANNCIPAILGISMQEAFCNLDITKISVAIWKEGLAIIKKCGINLVSLPDFPIERLTKLTSLPILEAAKIFSGIMVNLSKEPLYGSILQSIKRGRPSEIDYINGEFVTLAKENNLSCPLNEKLVGIVHLVERTNKFFSQQELIEVTKNLIN